MASKFTLEPWQGIAFTAHEEWLVKKLLPRRGLALLYGKSQSLKSFVVLDIAAHVAAGWPWAGRAVTQAPVVYIAAEGAGGLRKRKIGWQLTHTDAPSDLSFDLVAAAPNLGTDAGDHPALIAAIEAAGRKPGVIVLGHAGAKPWRRRRKRRRSRRARTIRRESRRRRDGDISVW